MAKSFVLHGDIQADDVASPEPAVFKGFQVFGSLFVVPGFWFLISISCLLFLTFLSSDLMSSVL